MSKKLAIINIGVTVILCLSVNLVRAQSVPVGTPALEDYYRRMQLSGGVDSNISFSIRPLHPTLKSNSQDIFNPDSADNAKWTSLKPVYFGKGKGKFELLPVLWQQQFNSNHPYGWNDGPMIPAKGYQTMVSGGFFFKYGPLSIQFRPEFVYAANPAFTGYASGHNDAELNYYYDYYNYIDNPERYGTGSYSKASLGQSSIRLTFGPVSFGLSNENLWWGPGVRNSLILSNNAPGFKHVTINTVRPINTFIGSFEAQVIGARLESSKFSPLLTTQSSTGTNFYNVKRDDWRYYSGFNINYHPKWVPGLFVGLIRSFDAYAGDVKGLNGYIPFFTPYQKANINPDGSQGDTFDRDQVTSIYARWLFYKAKAEVYFEYGLNDNSYNLNDFYGSPQHSRAYLVGLRKLVVLKDRTNEGILFSGEITQLSQTVDRFLRDAGGWYRHYGVRQGLTNEGQVLGAGTGSGGNLQSIDVSWVKGLKKLGVLLERYEHDVDFQQAYFPAINGYSRKWVDLGIGLQGDWNYKNLILNAKLEGVNSLNYQWITKNYDPQSSNYYVPNNTVFNLHMQLGLMYRF